MIIICNGNIYEGGQLTVGVLVGIAKDKMRGAGFAIVAVEKGNQVEMKNDLYSSKVKLYERKKEYEDAGFKVYIVDRGFSI